MVTNLEKEEVYEYLRDKGFKNVSSDLSLVKVFEKDDIIVKVYDK